MGAARYRRRAVGKIPKIGYWRRGIYVVGRPVGVGLSSRGGRISFLHSLRKIMDCAEAIMLAEFLPG
jgi:hypothetical protein